MMASLGFELSEDELDGFLEEMKMHTGSDEMTFEGFTGLIGQQQSAQAIEVRKLWPLLDADGDGNLTFEEVTKALSQCGIAGDEEGMKAMLDSADKDGDGLISFEEFCAASSELVWKKALSMLSIKKKFVSKMLSIQDAREKWLEVQAEKEIAAQEKRRRHGSKTAAQRLLELDSEDSAEESSEEEEPDWEKERAILMQRYALREHPVVHAAIREIWNVIEGLRRSEEHDGMMSRELFLTLFLKIAKVVLKGDFEEAEHVPWAEEEWTRELQRYATCNGGHEAGHIDFDIFYEGMFELLDFEVSMRGEKDITPERYARFVGNPYNRSGVFDTVFEEQHAPATQKKRKGKEQVTEQDQLKRIFKWRTEEFNYVGVSRWESIDRVAEAALESKLAQLNASAKQVFRQIDTSGDGTLSLSEVTCALSDLGIRDSDIEKIILKLDTNSDGVIDEKEFVNGYRFWAKAVEESKPVNYHKYKGPEGSYRRDHRKH